MFFLNGMKCSRVALIVDRAWTPNNTIAEHPLNEKKNAEAYDNLKNKTI